MDELLDHSLEQPAARLSRQALWFFIHVVLALAAWFGLMLAGYAVNPTGVPQWAILLASLVVPLLIGLIVARLHSDDMGTTVWLLGLIWMMIVSLWILDMPTGPGQCFQCGATEKLTRTFFCIPRPSGLIDDDGPFIGTWPSAALIGYSIGAWFGRRRPS
jgi:uncharacterized membrane protein YhaH (DUF805 family)